MPWEKLSEIAARVVEKYNPTDEWPEDPPRCYVGMLLDATKPAIEELRKADGLEARHTLALVEAMHMVLKQVQLDLEWFHERLQSQSKAVTELEQDVARLCARTEGN